ncbi:MAG: pantothenate kinase [Phormidesmis sp.]
MSERNSKHGRGVNWLALVIGNTRLHWGYFYRDRLLETWHTPHLTLATIRQLQRTNFKAKTWQSIATKNKIGFPSAKVSSSEIWIASAVPAQMALWRAPEISESMSVHQIERSHIPLANIYETLGIDRAVNLLGAGQLSGWPVVVIDGGTALTFTAGAICQGNPGVYGGAILPGLRLQHESLAQKTAALGEHMPSESSSNSPLPARWAVDTEGAIASGLAYSITATLVDYLTDWWQKFANGKAIITGGDAPLLHRYLQQRTPEVASRVLMNQELMFYGMQRYRRELMLF